MKIKGKHISIGIFVVLMFCAFFFPRFKSFRINKEAVIINGVEIIRIGKVNRTYGNYNYHFSFEVNGEVISTYSRNGLPENITATELYGRKFPVIYQKSNPSNANILITKRDFERFDIPFPDSLQWLYKKGN
jgi:hypothetical protein